MCFRDLEEDLNKALTLFGNKNAGGLVLLRKYEDYYQGYTDEEGKAYEGYQDLIHQLLTSFPLGERILGEEKKAGSLCLYAKSL